MYLIGVAESVIYVGQAVQLHRRYLEHYDERHNFVLRDILAGASSAWFAFRRVFSEEGLNLLERCYISTFLSTVINVQHAARSEETQS